MPEYWLSLGSNLGNRKTNLFRALKQLNSLGTVLKRSSVYETKPVGTAARHNFLNMACKLRTQLQPFRLLRKLKQIETEFGRIRTERWGNRIIDLDIIYWNGKELHTNILTIPHHLMENRAFVLIPLAECCADLINHQGKSIKELMGKLSDPNDVRLYKRSENSQT